MNITETGGDEQHQRPTAVLEGTEISDSVARALALGWSVIPCRRDKRPCLSWRKFQEVRATEEEIRSWQATYNPSAWAVITGQVSGVVVLDFDGEAGNRTRTALRLTPDVKTGSGGSHVYVDHPGWSTRTVNGKSKTILGEQFPGLDIRGDGGYAVFCGQNESGNYQWVREMRPDPLDTVPTNLRALLGLPHPPESGTRRPPASTNSQTHSRDRVAADRLIGRALEQSGTGRNDAGFWLAGQLRDNAYSRVEAEAILSEFVSRVPPSNGKGHDEPYTRAEALASVEQAYQHSPREPWAKPSPPNAGLSVAGPEPVLAAFKNAKGASVKVPAGFRLSGAGVFSVDPTGEKDDTFISSRLEIVACTRNTDGEEWGRLLEWNDRDALRHQWAMPMSILSGDGNELRARLFSGGLEISSNRKARELLATYIQTAKPEGKARCVSQIGWHDSSFVLPDTTIGCADGEQVLYQSANGTEHNYRTAGTLEEWQAQVGRPCSGNSRLLFGVSSAFAGALLGVVGGESSGFHLRSASSTGKTTVLLLAGSCWGGGRQNGFVQTWRATANGLEAVAELHNHGLLCLDELGQVDPKEAGETAYLLANGRGKNRMARTIQRRRQLTWNLLFLSSGEISLMDHMRAVGRKTRAGQEVRLLDIEADAGAGMGVFENLHETATPDEFARHLGLAARTYYGTPARAFLEVVASRHEEFRKAVRRFSQDFLTKHVPDGSSDEVSRAAGRFALVGAAGELATEFGVTGWREGEAEGAAKACFDS